jgi:hypothetical protein
VTRANVTVDGVDRNHLPTALTKRAVPAAATI